ncbi:hypothetical protein ACGFY7_34820 [Streptomyces prunicolor]|uniref:hypothetical protein n=1 Tax=Streptomyces prunicolor TaxID=67348 RepID=UPI0037116373
MCTGWTGNVAQRADLVLHAVLVTLVELSGQRRQYGSHAHPHERGGALPEQRHAHQHRQRHGTDGDDD